MAVTPPYLVPRVSDRGFQSMPELSSGYGVVSVYESSRADLPCLWVRVQQPGSGEGVAELTLEYAARLRDQLDYLINSHYQKELF